MPVTEIACMGVKPNISLTDPSTPEHDLLVSIWKNIMTLSGGPSRVYWGVESASSSLPSNESSGGPSSVEGFSSQGKLWTFFDWASVQEHEAFAVAYGAAAVEKLPLILTHGEFTKHVVPKPFPAEALRSPLTTLLLLSFPSDIPASRQTDITATLTSTFEGVHGVEGLSVAWGIETDFPVRGGKEGETGALCVVFVGWRVKDMRETVMESKGWEEGVQKVREVEGLTGFEVVELECETMGRVGEGGEEGE